MSEAIYQVGTPESPLSKYQKVAVWLEYRGIELKIKRYDNDFLTASQTLVQSNPDWENEKCMKYAAAMTLVEDWRSKDPEKIIADINGEELKYSAEAGCQAFMEDQDIYAFVLLSSKREDLFITETPKGEVAKKS